MPTFRNALLTDQFLAEVSAGPLFLADNRVQLHLILIWSRMDYTGALGLHNFLPFPHYQQTLKVALFLFSNSVLMNCDREAIYCRLSWSRFNYLSKTFSICNPYPFRGEVECFFSRFLLEVVHEGLQICDGAFNLKFALLSFTHGVYDCRPFALTATLG